MTSLFARDARAIAGIARLRFSPLCVVGGRGNRLIEEGGRELLDLSGSFGAASLGYSHPAIARAVSTACTVMAGAGLLSLPNENAIAPCACCRRRPAVAASSPSSAPITATCPAR